MSRSDRNTSGMASWVWWPEAVAYFLLGTVTAVLGLIALARWVAVQWQSGAHLEAALPVLAAVLVAVLFVVGLRTRRPVLVLGALLAWCGFGAYVLSGYGVSLPESWLAPLK